MKRIINRTIKKVLLSLRCMAAAFGIMILIAAGVEWIKVEEAADKFAETISRADETESCLEVHFIDVGQADAALILCDGEAMLIDGGNRDGSSMIYTYLKKKNVSYLDYMIASHAHEDHVGGLAGALNYADVETVYCPVTAYDSEAFENFKKYVSERGAEIEIPAVGEQFNLGGAVVEILGVNGGSEANDTSIVLKITHGEVSFLFTGDAEREAEQAVLSSGCDLSSTVLKVGHHGSADSTTYPFLREIMPEYAVISVGKDNGYGHPTENTLSRLRDAGVTVFRTDLQGDIIAVSDTKTVNIVAEKNQNIDTLVDYPTYESEWFEETSEEIVTEGDFSRMYVLNTNTRKFHYPSCDSVLAIKAKNYAEYMGTAEEIEELGYVGCKRCNPH